MEIGDASREEGDHQSTSRGHVAIEVAQAHEYDSLVIPIKERMETITTARCICRVVGERLYDESEKAYYIPDKISIGPFHHGKEPLNAMEDQKWRYLYSLLNRKPHLEASLDKCVKALRELEHKARLCYAEEITLSSDDFVQLMLVDAGFLIELFLKNAVRGLKRRGDPIFNTPGLLFDLRCNMILLENQIPLFVLQRLFQIVPIPNQCKLSLTELAFLFFKNMIPGDHQVHLNKFSQEGNHLLDLIRHCFLPTCPRVKVTQDAGTGAGHSSGLSRATQLRAAGVRLRKAATPDLLDIKFVKGVLEIPPLQVHQYTESLLRNLIALEQCRPSESTHHISSYVVLMKSLMHSNRDAKLLKTKQILSNYDASFDDKEFSTVFERLVKKVKLRDFYYDGLCEQVNEYKRSSLQAWWQTMKARYLMKHPIFSISTLFIFIALLATLVSMLSLFLHGRL